MLRSSASASNCTISRPVLRVDARLGVRRDVERDRHVVRAGIDARDDARDAQVADDQQARGAAKIEPDVERGESARGRKSAGTNHRPSRRSGGAGSVTRRPATDTTFWFSVTTIERVRAVIVRPPASRSSRDVVRTPR